MHDCVFLCLDSLVSYAVSDCSGIKNDLVRMSSAFLLLK